MWQTGVMCWSLLEKIKNEKKKWREKQRHGPHAHVWSSAAVRAESITGAFFTLLVNSTHCTTPTCACASWEGTICSTGTREPSGLSQEMSSLVTAAVSHLHFCHSSDALAGLPRNKLQSTMAAFMHFSQPPSPCTTENWQHMCLCVLHASACFSGTKGPNPRLIISRLWGGFFVMSFPVVTEVAHLFQTFHNPRCPLALMDRGWQPLVTRRQS